MPIFHKRLFERILVLSTVMCSFLLLARVGEEGFSRLAFASNASQIAKTPSTPGVTAANSSPRIERAFPQLSFSRPVDLASPRDGSNRLFVVEQEGRIRVFPNKNKAASTKTFLDIRGRVNSQGVEEGLLGLAFHPNYAKNRFFFVNYTADNPRRTVISRFRASSTNPNQADPDSEKVILQFKQPYPNHNGGQLAFGPDGYLYIGTGDGGGEGDPEGNAQNRATLLGDLLRISVNASSKKRPYAIPPSNPYAGNTKGFREEIFASGLRNLWRFSFDPKTNRIWGADVGQERIEEINLLEKGKNYGWNVMEGSACYNRSTCKKTGLMLPIAEYTHKLGQSITGGFVYRGKRVPSLVGAYIYADFVSGRIWKLRYNGQKVTENVQVIDTELNISSFGVDENRELYLLAFNGYLYRFR